MIYRLADESDINSLAEMRYEFETNGEEVNVLTLRDEFIKECTTFLRIGIKNGSWACWIAEDKGEIIANIYVNRIRKVPKPQKIFAEIGYVTNVYTKADYRDKGIGTQLLKSVKEWATTDGIELLFVWPSKKSVGFYKKEGFSMHNDIMELTCNEG